jgi:hypothetical protein
MVKTVPISHIGNINITVKTDKIDLVGKVIAEATKAGAKTSVAHGLL